MNTSGTRTRILPDLGGPFFVLVIAHVAIAVGMGTVTGFSFNPQMPQLLAVLLGILMPWFVWIMLAHLIWRLAVVEKSQAPLKDTLAVLKTNALDHRWQLQSAMRFLLAALFIASTGYLKELITVLQPFAWDVSFAELDRWLHFGQDPWRLLQPITGSYAVTKTLNIVYHGWFFAIYFAVFVACFGRGALSRAFLISFVLAFAIGGNLLATIFSSAGPVYYERLGLGSDFAPLMSSLEAMNQIGRLPALEVQEALWQAYLANGGNAAISAMPSMHVATSVLMVFFAFGYSRLLGWVMTVFAMLMMVGSVQLGWHYAVDGYLGALIAWMCWRAGVRLAESAP
ncbi:MAG: hypothetical protein HKN18_18205 [Silicimonas sp.]|nr:hypothetical protein [Silicimonas sp.]